MSKNVKVAGTSYTGVPAIILPLATGSGTAKFTDTSASTVTAERIVSGYGAYDSTGTWVNGTSPGENIIIDEVWSISGDTLFIDDGSSGDYNIVSVNNGDGTQNLIITDASGGGGGGATQHTIHLEFSDGTDTDIEVDYDDSFVGSLITGTRPNTYGQKSITLAQLDNVTWYEPVIIPLNTELIDYTKCTQGYFIGDDGDIYENEWSWVSDYTAVSPDMTFSYTAYYWYYIGTYDDSYNFIRSIYVMNDATQDQSDSNTGHGTLSGNKLPQSVAYIRLCGSAANSSKMSLIRTA